MLGGLVLAALALRAARPRHAPAGPVGGSNAEVAPAPDGSPAASDST